MVPFLGYAESGDPNELNLPIFLGGMLFLAAVAAMAFFVMFIARARRHRKAESITTAAIFWALFAAGTIAYAAISQMAWSKQYTQQLESGYLDPRDVGDRPALPWTSWAVLTVAYGGLIAWSLSQHNLPPPGSPPDEPA